MQWITSFGKGAPRLQGVKSPAHLRGQRHHVAIGESGAGIGDGRFLVIAGPCAVESREGLLCIARGVATSGAGVLRGGAWKPRTSPRSFQGLGAGGLELLAAARTETGLSVVTEVLDPRDVAIVAEVADVLQVGRATCPTARCCARSDAGLSVLLKRGFGATVAELLDAAEYLFAEGNENVVLVERGIRTFETATRFTLDISAVPVLRERTHLPIIVDPSHVAGMARWVPDLALAAAAEGADGVMVEVHDDPSASLSDAGQALTLAGFHALVQALDPIVAAVVRQRGIESAPAHLE